MINLIEIDKNRINILPFDTKELAEAFVNKKLSELNIMATKITSTNADIYETSDYSDNTNIWIITDTAQLHLETLVPNGRLITDTNPNPYAGVDIEYSDNNEDDNTNVLYRPRILIEKPEDTMRLRTAIWTGHQEDYDENIIFD